MKKRYLENVEDINALAMNLNGCDSVRGYDRPDETQAGVIAHALSDIEGSIVKLSEELIPKLIFSAKNSEAMKNALSEIGHELAHIVYHVKDTKYFEDMTGMYDSRFVE